MKTAVLILMFMIVAFPELSMAALKAPDVLDNEELHTNERLGKYSVVGVRLFSIDDVEYENVDGSEMRRLLKKLPECQTLLARTIRRGLSEFGYESIVIKDESDAVRADMILEGRITAVDLGNAATRVFLFFEGNIGLSVEGRLVDARTGSELARFSHECSSGLDESFDKWQMLFREVGEMGNDIADFTGMLK